jgi:ketosteroid isomerase-like protein
MTLRTRCLATLSAVLALWTASSPARAGDEPDLCSAGQLPMLSTDQRAICDHGREWIAVFKRGDIDGLMAMYTADAQVALHDQKKLVGIGAIRAYFAPALAQRPRVEFDLHVEAIRVHGDVAHLISRYWYTSVQGNDPPIQDAGRSLLIYQRAHDPAGKPVWKIMVDIDQSTPDVGFPAPRR